MTECRQAGSGDGGLRGAGRPRLLRPFRLQDPGRAGAAGCASRIFSGVVLRRQQPSGRSPLPWRVRRPRL